MPVNAIGIMSGSSLDGLDMALCTFDDKESTLAWHIHDAQMIPFPLPFRERLKASPTYSGFDLSKLDADFGGFIGCEIRSWMKTLSLHVDFIASHGHTVFHEPSLGFTTQIGSGAHIAFESGIDTITTFRNADIAAHGQGAPFAPAGDIVLFPGYDGYLNLGGIANINLRTFEGVWKAWDIGPCNQALNFLSSKMGYAYDHNGQLAASGNILQNVVGELIAMYPIRGGKPKGLSNAEVQSSWISYLNKSNEKVIDLLTSTTEAMSQMVMEHISDIIRKPATILVTGGGAHNLHVITRLHELSLSKTILFQLPSPLVIDYKESLLMAYLGFLTIQGKPYGIRQITGASVDTIGGAIFKAVR